MLGPAKPRRLDQPVAASLEALVPRNHFYRHLEAKLNLGFVREWTQEFYSERGRPSFDPVVFFKLQLVMFFEGIRSERQLIATVSLNLAHRWYLGRAAVRRGEALAWLTSISATGLANVNFKGLLIAAGQNLKRWLAATEWGRRHVPAGASLPSHATRDRSSLGSVDHLPARVQVRPLDRNRVRSYWQPRQRPFSTRCHTVRRVSVP